MIIASQVSDLAMIDAEEWDALVGLLGFYDSYDWLRSQHRSVAATATYVLVKQDGWLIAAAPVYEFGPEWEPTNRESSRARAQRRGQIGAKPLGVEARRGVGTRTGRNDIRDQPFVSRLVLAHHDGNASAPPDRPRSRSLPRPLRCGTPAA